MAVQTQKNQNQADVECETMILDYEHHGDEVAEAIEMLTMLEICIVNPDLTGCGRVPVSRLSIGHDFITVQFGNKKITYTRGGKVTVETSNAALLVGDRFVLFSRRDGSLEPRTMSMKITWHATEEVFYAYEFRKMIRDAIATILEVARDVLQS